MCCFSSIYLLMSCPGGVEQQDWGCAEETKVKGELCHCKQLFQITWDFSLFLILLSHPIGICTYVNLCDGVSVLSESCLPGEADSLLLMFRATNFWQLPAPRTVYEVQGGLAACCCEQRYYQFLGWATEEHPHGRVEVTS